MPTSPVPIPLAVRLHLGRAAVQVVADRVGADILHIKGDAVDRTLRPVPDPGTDVDILVRPAHVARLDAALRAAGWTLYSSFAFGSPFGHAQTYLHDVWGYLDLHRCFPGVEQQPAAAFAGLWAQRHAIVVAGVACDVPAVPAQTAILLLNSARTPRRSDVDALWFAAPPQERARLLDEVRTLEAEVAFAAATGDLERCRGARTYPLWKAVTQGGSRAAEWRARIRAARTVRERAALVLRAPAVNVEQLTHRLGRAPTPADLARAFVARPLTALREWRRRPR